MRPAVGRRSELRDCIAAADFVVLCLPLGEDTRHIVGEPELRAMKPGAYLINVARGGAVDEMQVIFDGMRIVEPFHLRDYQGVFSAIDQRIVSGIEIYSGGFPPEYGDALSGVSQH